MSHNSSNLAEEHEQTKMSVVEDGSTAKKKSTNEDKTVIKKKVSSEDRPVTKKKVSSEDGPVTKKKVSSEDRPVTKKKVSGDDEPAAMKKPSNGKKPTAKKKPAAKKKSANGDKTKAGKKPVSSKKTTVRKASSDTRKRDSGRKEKNGNGEDFEERLRNRDEVRARRKAARLRKVRRQKIIMAVSLVVIVAVVIGGVVFYTPSMKLSRSLSKGDKCAVNAEYADAQNAYEMALEIDSGSVRAYRGMAANYLAQEKNEDAKQILYTGWEQTQDQGVLDYYCTVIYNEAVREINNKNCTLATVDKCIQVLEQEPDNDNALTLMGTCYERLFNAEEEDETCEIFYDNDSTQDTCSYTEYEQLLRRLLAVYQTAPSDRLKNILAQYALIDMPYVRISISHVAQYMALLTDINAVTGNEKITETIACLTRVQEVEDYFDTAFAEFEAENYAYARDLVVQESYQQLRDDFINENSGYWEGSTYIPVNREQITLHNENGHVSFYFPGEGDYDNKQGIIKIWGTKQEDDGVQRSAVSYVPAGNTEGGHTEYKVQYLYSNVKIGNEYVPQMNYRFDTEITTAEGTTTNAIGDWGGEHEWEIDY